MGQKFGKSVEANSVDDRSGVSRETEEVDLFWAAPATSSANTGCEGCQEVDWFWSSLPPGPSTANTGCEYEGEVDLFWALPPAQSTANTGCEEDEEVDLFWTLRTVQDKRDQTPEVVAVPADRNTDDEIPVQNVNQELLENLETLTSDSSVSQSEEKLGDNKKPSVVIPDEIPGQDVTQELENLETLSSESSSVSQSEEEMENDENSSEIIQEINGRQYKIGVMLGEGGFAWVFEGTRVQDGLKVAVKVVEKTRDVIKHYINIPGHPEPLPCEVGLHMLACEGGNNPVIVQFLDWQEYSDQFLMVLEFPSPCEDILCFMKRRGGSIPENVAQSIVRQATEAAEICCQRGVFHRDIKLENLLINPKTLEVKIIDFGCGDLLKESAYTEYMGTQKYVCPEYFETGEYHSKPATVYSLGVLMYAMLCGKFPSSLNLGRISQKIWYKDGLTEECCDLIRACLQEDPEERIDLEKILQHKWFQDNDPADGLQTPDTSVSQSAEEMEDEEKSSVFIQEINGRQYDIDRMQRGGDFRAISDLIFFTLIFLFFLLLMFLISYRHIPS